MILIISQSKDIAQNLIKSTTLSDAPIFAYYRFVDCLEDSFDMPPRAIIINECGNIEESDKICDSIKKRFPNIPALVILNGEFARDSLFRYTRNADFELISPFSVDNFVDFLKKADINHDISHFSPTLSCSSQKSTLLGYDLCLSHSENRILIFLVAFRENIVSPKLIKEACFIAESSVRVLIERINRKATGISGRPLIISHYGKGYSINKNP